MVTRTHPPLPGQDIDPARAPAHWVLARIGKQVLRPGGRRLTLGLLERLGITDEDRVVEFAPGVGATTRLLLDREPAGYTGIERDPYAASVVQDLLEAPAYTCCTSRRPGDRTGPRQRHRGGGRGLPVDAA